MGGGKKSKAPDPPDYTSLAKQQASDSHKIAQDITKWNRPNQTDQYGNKLSWTQDKNGGWSQNVTLGNLSKADLDRTMASRTRAQLEVEQNLKRARAQGAFTRGAMPKYDEASGKAVSDATYQSMMARERPQQQRDLGALTNQLRQQGLQPGTQAYDSAMRNLMTAQGDVSAQAANAATIAGYDEARQRYLAQLQGNSQDFGQRLSQYNQPLQSAAAMQTIAGPSMNPSFAGFSGATGYNPADMLGAANAGYQAQMGGANSSNAKKGSALGSGLGFAGSMLGGK